MAYKDPNYCPTPVADPFPFTNIYNTKIRKPKITINREFIHEKFYMEDWWIHKVMSTIYTASITMAKNKKDGAESILSEQRAILFESLYELRDLFLDKKYMSDKKLYLGCSIDANKNLGLKPHINYLTVNKIDVSFSINDTRKMFKTTLFELEKSAVNLSLAVKYCDKKKFNKVLQKDFFPLYNILIDIVFIHRNRKDINDIYKAFNKFYKQYRLAKRGKSSSNINQYATHLYHTLYKYLSKNGTSCPVNDWRFLNIQYDKNNPSPKHKPCSEKIEDLKEFEEKRIIENFDAKTYKKYKGSTSEDLIKQLYMVVKHGYFSAIRTHCKKTLKEVLVKKSSECPALFTAFCPDFNKVSTNSSSLSYHSDFVCP